MMQPGIYPFISNHDYHHGAGISKSQLDLIAECPALLPWQKNAPVDEEKTGALDFGTAFHCLCLEPGEFDKRYAVAPVVNRKTTKGKEEEAAFIAECASVGITPLSAEDAAKLRMMHGSAMAHPLARWMLESSGQCESSIYWEDDETGVLCRCRPDKIITDFHWLIDVKTTADMDRFSRTFYDYRYHVQDAFYTDGYKSQVCEQPVFAFLVVSTSINCGRYPVNVFILDQQAKDAGRAEYQRNLRTYRECLDSNEWPGIKTLSLPRWAKELRNDQ
ncbi:PD-(D/E)XK nuclease-like domain-containing protein [Edwardsiella piscicida]|nr:PD-(D/E)XK nuclease-like domain-containing protein [Edwardsiella piscicida]WGS75589.1 PD-(D/E)XK nuclease-like domain-containing protein [Edwardsiella piscicida]WGS78978.1 PD-(D/E)XK nuclease-like domain-containing protein [Edwardsiella piscicida]